MFSDIAQVYNCEGRRGRTCGADFASTLCTSACASVLSSRNSELLQNYLSDTTWLHHFSACCSFAHIMNDEASMKMNESTMSKSAKDWIIPNIEIIYFNIKNVN